MNLMQHWASQNYQTHLWYILASYYNIAVPKTKRLVLYCLSGNKNSSNYFTNIFII